MNDERPLTQHIRPGEPLDLPGKLRVGGYQGLVKARTLSPAQILDEVKRSNLRGRGGAGFPTGMKWSFVPMGDDAPRPKYIVANGDEMEPGTFKDRLLMEGDPHQLIEGMVIAACAVDAEAGYIFVRGEYALAIARLTRAIAEAESAGYLGPHARGSDRPFALHVHASAGRYMCGEETGLLNALEGKRANPRAKPPFPQVSGLWGKPTVVQNIETLCCLPHILINGWSWFRGLGRTGDGGTKLYGASGRVKRPGLWELPMGTPARQILECAGGLRDGYQLRGFMPGGASTEFLLPSNLDIPLDFSEPQKAGSRLGTGCLIVLDDRTCPVGMVHNLEEFFARESCGWCTPCWSGLPWTERVLFAIEQGQGQPGDLEILEHQTRQCGLGRTFCALAPGAMEPLQSALLHFREDFQRHIDERRCPWRA